MQTIFKLVNLLQVLLTLVGTIKSIEVISNNHHKSQELNHNRQFAIGDDAFLQESVKLMSTIENDKIHMRTKRQAEKYLKALDISLTYFDGKPVAKSSYLDCNTDKSCSFSVTYQHTESVRHSASIGVEMSPVSILKLVAHVAKDKLSADATTTAYGVTVGPHSRARMMFKPKLVKIKGRIELDKKCIKRTERIIGGILTMGITELINKDAPECSDHKLGPFEIVAPAPLRNSNNKNEVILDGEWFLEYSDNPLPVDNELFHNFRDKNLPDLDEAFKYEKTVGNPIMCAKLAKDYSYKVAIYYNATCHMYHSTDDFKCYTNEGKFVGDFGIELKSVKETSKLDAMHEWVEEKKCDMIEHDEHKFYCKKFVEKPKSVIMFRKSTKPSPDLLDMTEVGDPIE